MATNILMPQLGLTMTEGVITHWLKAEGDPVAKGEPLFEVETDKLTNEVESAEEGVLLKILALEGGEVPVQGLVAVIGKPGEHVGEASGIPSPVEQPDEADLSNEPMHTTQDKPAVPVSERLRVSPLAMKLASREGMELASLRGSGPGGRIVRRDVETALTRESADSGDDSSNKQKDWPFVRRVRMSAMRRTIARNMSRSWSAAPVVHYNRRADVAAIARLKSELSEAGWKVSYTDIMIKLVATVLMEHPLLNASLDGEDIFYHDYVNMGVAVALEDGLVVPVIRNAQNKGIGTISAEIKDMAARAKNGALRSDEMQGGTFTITNLGAFGIESFTPIINQPESAILGIGTIVEQPVTTADGIEMREYIMLSLTADHRIIDGAVAAQFLHRVCSCIEAPWLMLI